MVRLVRPPGRSLNPKQNSLGGVSLKERIFTKLKRRWLLVAIATLLIILIGGNAVKIYSRKQKQKEQLLQETQQQVKELDSQLKEKEKVRLELENKTKELEQKLQAKANQKPVVRVASVTTVPKTEAEAKLFIYLKESGNRTNAINKSSGACGLGQALPCSKLDCSLDDYDCQDKWFTNYAIRRYGSWVGAYQFWLSHHWW